MSRVHTRNFGEKGDLGATKSVECELLKMSGREELEAQLEEYREQLASIEALLLEDAENEEYVEMKSATMELIADLQKLLSPPPAPSKPSINSSDPASLGDDAGVEKDKTSVEVNTKLENQVEIALERGLFVGLPCEAIWAEDGLWYPATIESISEAGVRVKFKSYGDVKVVEAKAVRTASIFDKKRKTPSGTSEEPEHVDNSIPEHLRYADTDTEKTREWKKRQQKIFKSEKRKEALEIAQNKSKVSWQNFNKNSKKAGFSTKRESMFRTTDNFGGKIGVIGSGKSMTPQTTTSTVPPPRYQPSPSSFQTSAPSANPSYDPLSAPSYYIPQQHPAPYPTYHPTPQR